MRVILAEIVAYDPVEDQSVTLRLSTAGLGPKSVLNGGFRWTPVITTAPVLSVTFDTDGIPGKASVSYSDIGIRFSSDPGINNIKWKRYDFDGAPIKIYTGAYGSPFATYTQIFDGKCGALSSDTAVTGTITLRGIEADLTKELLSSEYAGTGDAEGFPDLKGTLKPFTIGAVENADQFVCVDPSLQIYQYHGYGPTGGVVKLYEQAIDKGPPVVNVVTTYAQLKGLVLTEAQWVNCPALGMFRLGGQPTGKLTADLIGAKNGADTPLKAGEISTYLLGLAGISTGKIDYDSAADFDADFPWRWGAIYNSQTKISDVVQTATSHALGYTFPNHLGMWIFGRYKKTKAPITLRHDRSTRPLVENIQQAKAATRAYKVRVGGRRAWYVNSDSEISDALKQRIDSVTDSVVGIIETAEDAVEQVIDLKTQIEGIADGIFDEIALFDDLPATVIQGLSAADKVARAYGESAASAVTDLREELLADGTNYAAAITALNTRVGNAESALLSEQSTRANADSANANNITLLGARVDDAEAAISDEQTARVTADDALASSITALQATVGNVDARVTSEATARANADSALATQIQTTSATLTNTINSAISVEQTARANGDAANASSISALQARMNNAEASIVSEQTARSNGDSANASAITSINSRLNNVGGVTLEQRFTTQASQITGLSAQYVVRINNNGHAAGFGLASGAGGTSAFAVQADAFYITHSNGAGSAPFSVVGGVATIKNASIGTANITNANLVNATLKGEKLEDFCTFGFGAYFNNLSGWRTSASTWATIGGISVPVSTTIGNQKVVITFSFIAARDGGDDDNLVISMRRNDGKYLQNYYDVQIFSGRRVYTYIFYDETVSNHTSYTYTPVYYSIKDGNPYWYNVGLTAIVYKK